MRTEVSNWGRWGEEDERGAANLVTAEKTLRSLAIPKSGEVYTLAQPLQAKGVPMVTDRPGPIHLFASDGGDYAAGARPSNGCCSAEDFLILPLHGHTTHVDSLGHVWNNDQIYNGFSSHTVRGTGMRHCGIDKLGHLLTRGLMLDVAAALSVSHLAGGQTITPQDVEACLDRQSVAIEAGDVVLLRTGWTKMYYEDAHAYETSWPGIGVETAHWLAANDISMVGVDNPSIEVKPFPPDTTAPVHQVLLRDYGIYMLELLNLEEISTAEVYEFLFVLAPLKFRGATGSPVSPLAIV